MGEGQLTALWQHLELNQRRLSEIGVLVREFVGGAEKDLVRGGDLTLHVQRSVRPLDQCLHECLDIRCVASVLPLHPLGTAFKVIKLVAALNPYPLTYVENIDSCPLYTILQGSGWQVYPFTTSLYKLRAD